MNVHRFSRQVFLVIFLAATGAVAQTGTVPLDSGTPPSGLTNSNITVANGNVGIGTPSPNYALHLGVGNVLRLEGGSSASDSANYFSFGGDGTFGIDGNGIVNGRFVVLNGGNVGIGTANPTQLLQLDNGNIALWKHNYSYPVAAGMYYGPKISFSQNCCAPDSSGAAEIGSIANTAWSHGWLPSGGLYFSTSQQDQQPAVRVVIDNIGNFGIGTTSPGAKLEVNGNIKLTSGSGASITFPDGTVQSTAWSGTLCGGDYAEAVDITGERSQYEPGDVLVVDPDHPGHFLKATEKYSTLVAGIYSTKPGMIGRRQTIDPNLASTEIPMAMVGVVPTKVTAENGPIHPGDLLVTSSTSGRAMKGTDRSLFAGAIVGKALGSLNSGTGVIEALVSLQ